MLRFSVLVFCVLMSTMASYAQTDGVSIDFSGSPVREPKAIFQLNSTEQGVILPRMLSSDRTAIAPPGTAQGMVVYQTDAPEGFYYWDGTQWLQLTASSGSGHIENRAINNNFSIGQAASFDITGNGEIGGTLEVGSSVGIGTTAPLTNLHVTGASSFDNTYGINLVNGANDFGRTHLRLTGRMQGGNDGWSMNGRNNILFAANSNTSGVGIGALGTDRFAIQYQMLVDKLGVLSSTGGATPLMVIQQDGNVGFGTASPAERIHVEGEALIDLYHQGSGSGLYFREGFTSGSYNLGLLVHDDGDASADALDIAAFDGIYFNTGSNTRNPQMVVTQAGNVGIGEDNPLVKLDISSTDAMRVPGGTTAQRPAGAAGYVRFNSDSKMLEYHDGTQWVPSNVGQTPIGTIVPFAGPNLPAGWLRCDGATVSRVTYADLYTSIGNTWGSGNGTTTFHLPDLRGRFARGVDSGAGRDPDAASRTASNAGGNTGVNLGSVQTDAALAHTHGVTDPGHTHTVDPANTAVSVTVGAHTHTVDPPNTSTTTNGNHNHGMTTRQDDYNVSGGSGPSFGADNGNFLNYHYTSDAGNHSHTIDIGQFNSGSATPSASGSVDIPSTGSSSNATGISIQGLAGSTETRPENAYVHYIIKAQNTAELAIVSPNIPNGIAGQTLRYDGSNWMANSTIFNNGTNVGIGTTSPQARLHLADGYPLLAGNDGMLKIKTVAGNCCGTEVVSLQTSIDNRADDYNIAGYGGEIRHVLSLQPQGGFVGIGTNNPTAKLEVAGQVKLTGGAPGAGKVLTSDADGDATWEQVGVPTGAVMYFDLASCPTGWTEFIAARGRYAVGLPAGGTLGGSVGTALTNQENRATGQHSHAVDPPSTTSSSNGTHDHSRSGTGAVANGSYGLLMRSSGTSNTVASTDQTVGEPNIVTAPRELGLSSAGTAHTHTVDIASFNSGSSGSVAGTNAPYVQLLVCKKN